MGWYGGVSLRTVKSGWRFAGAAGLAFALVMVMPVLASAHEHGPFHITNVQNFQPGGTTGTLTFTDSNSAPPDPSTATLCVAYADQSTNGNNGCLFYASNLGQVVSDGTTSDGIPQYTETFDYSSYTNNLQWNTGYQFRYQATSPTVVSDHYDVTTPIQTTGDLPEVPYAAVLPLALLAFIPVVRKLRGGKGSSQPMA